MKSFDEALRDGFAHVTEITDPNLLTELRQEGVQIDSEGYYTFLFGEHKEYELRVEPIGEDEQYQIALYKNRVVLTQKLPVWTRRKKDSWI